MTNNDITVTLTVLVCAGLVYLIFAAFVGSMNRRVQLRKIQKAKQEISVFIRSNCRFKINPETKALEYFTDYSPYYKRPVCAAKGQEIEFLDTPIDFSSEYSYDVDYTNQKQIEEIAHFWRSEYIKKASNNYHDIPLWW